MLLADWGIRRSQQRLAKQLQTIPGAGTPASRLRRLASSNLDIHCANQGQLMMGLDNFLLAWDEMANLFGLIRKV
jgi:DNA repair ATPase RecN